MPYQNLPSLPLPPSIIQSYIHPPSSALTFHILSANPTNSSKLLLLLHGFPDLAFSWRKVILPLAEAGYHVVAPDQRGYGRTTGYDARAYEEVDLSQFSAQQLVADVVALVGALGYAERGVECVVGHDFGAVAASSFAVARPDLARRLIVMSHPFAGTQALRAAGDESGESGDSKGVGKGDASTKSSSSSSSTTTTTTTIPRDPDIHTSLANLSPPRKAYKWYNSTPTASSDWDFPPQGLQSFLRGYFYLKSGLFYENRSPSRLTGWTAPELAKLPGYYTMPLPLSMPATVSAMLSQDSEKGTIRLAEFDTLFPPSEVEIYAREYERTGFQPSLNWYRAFTHPTLNSGFASVFAGLRPVQPVTFISGDRDWGNWQDPGALDGMAGKCRDFRGVRFVEGAGHWPQIERAGEVVQAILEFLGEG